ncbi:MAG: hypothetical protein ACI8ZN_000528 [Bacteroidia bacterium]|jgi:hypothetical protein
MKKLLLLGAILISTIAFSKDVKRIVDPNANGNFTVTCINYPNETVIICGAATEGCTGCPSSAAGMTCAPPAAYDGADFSHD